MPRLTNQHYVERHKFLKTAWSKFPSLYALLPAHQQWDVHAYFQPSKELTEAELLEHRSRITKERPTLPAKASQLYQKLHRVYELSADVAEKERTDLRPVLTQQVPVTLTKSARGRVRGIRVAAIARPEPDLHRLALALVELAKEQKKSGPAT